MGDSNHAIHQIYAEEMDNQDQPDEDDQMGDEEDAWSPSVDCVV